MTQRLIAGWLCGFLIGIGASAANVPDWLFLLIVINYIVWLMWWVDKGGGKPPGRGTETMLALLIILTMAAPAQADELHSITGLTLIQHRIVERTWLPLPENVIVRQQACPLIPTTSCVLGTTPDIYLHPKHAKSSFALLHELGHQFHLQYMSDDDWQDYTELDGLALLDVELFATRYAQCAIDSRWQLRMYQTTLQGGTAIPRSPRYKRLCRTFLKWWVQ
jgi:hypothetical protein